MFGCYEWIIFFGRVFSTDSLSFGALLYYTAVIHWRFQPFHGPCLSIFYPISTLNVIIYHLYCPTLGHWLVQGHITAGTKPLKHHKILEMACLQDTAGTGPLSSVLHLGGAHKQWSSTIFIQLWYFCFVYFYFSVMCYQLLSIHHPLGSF